MRSLRARTARSGREPGPLRAMHRVRVADRTDLDRSLPALGASVLLGIGLGGFVDGIVLHQILQWHHLLTDEGDFPMNTLSGLEQNTVADGFFHAMTWVVVLAGMLVTLHAWLRRKLGPPWRHHVGAPRGGG